MKRLFMVGVILVSVTLRLQTLAVADTTRGPIIDPKAISLLEQAEEKLQSINTISVTSTTWYIHNPTPAKPIGGKFAEIRHIEVERPNLANVDVVARQLKGTPPTWQDSKIEIFNSNGHSSYRMYEDDKKIQNWPSKPDGSDCERDISGPMSGFFDPKMAISGLLDAWEKGILLHSMKYIGKSSYQGVSYDLVEVNYFYIDEGTPPEQHTYDIYIGKDQLIHRVDYTLPMGGEVDSDISDLKINQPISFD